MTAMPPATLYHRWLGWHALALRRTIAVAVVGLVVALVLLWFVTGGLAVVVGWDAAALTFLASVTPIIARADGMRTEQIATREDETHGTATAMLIGASVASLVGAGFTLYLAGRDSGAPRNLLIGVAVATVVLSWTAVNTVYTLHYAHLHYDSTGAGITFGDPGGLERPNYRDFAYVAFTIGMTYQVSDTTLRDPRIRRTVLSQALLAYLFGVVIVGGAVNFIAGLLR
jgi:uncharacterized membrane protein